MSAQIGAADSRRAEGMARRKQIARQDHALWDRKLRRRPPLELLSESMRGRVPKLVSVKYQRMLESPFAFFRGAVPIMAADLARLPHTGILNQICGDAHVQNLGAYSAPDGRLVFDINDFDETVRAPFEWDLKRMAASLVLAARETSRAKNGEARDAVCAFLEHYQECTRRFAELPVLEVARYKVHRMNEAAPVDSVLRKAERATPDVTLAKLTVPSGKGGRRIFREMERDGQKTLWRLGASKRQRVLDALGEYSKTLLPERRHFLTQYRPIDVCFKVVGTGSVGTRDYCIYLEGNGRGDPLFLQIKEAVGSAYLPYLNGTLKKAHRGRLVAEGQRAMQLQSDPMMGWTTIGAREYLVRQLNDHKASIDLTALKGGGLVVYVGRANSRPG